MSYVSTCLADGAVGLYTFGDATTAACVDSAGVQNGTYGNTAKVAVGQPGLSGDPATACAFTSGASNGYMQVVDNAAQHVGDTFTLEFWVKLAITGAQYSFMSANVAASPLMRILTNGKVELISSGVAVIGDSAGAITDTTTYHHVVWTKAAAVNHVYLDGAVSDGTYTNQTLINSTAWFFAAEGVGLDGTAAMFGIYPTALGAAAVANHYSLGQAPPVPGPALVYAQGDRW